MEHKHCSNHFTHLEAAPPHLGRLVTIMSSVFGQAWVALPPTRGVANLNCLTSLIPVPWFEKWVWLCLLHRAVKIEWKSISIACITMSTMGCVTTDRTLLKLNQKSASEKSSLGYQKRCNLIHEFYSWEALSRVFYSLGPFYCLSTSYQSKTGKDRLRRYRILPEVGVPIGRSKGCQLSNMGGSRRRVESTDKMEIIKSLDVS